MHNCGKETKRDRKSVATSNKCIATRNKCLTSSNKKLLETSASKASMPSGSSVQPPSTGHSHSGKLLLHGQTRKNPEEGHY